MQLINYLRVHAPAILTAIGAVYAVLVQQGVIGANNRLVTVIVAVLGALGVTVLHVRQQASLKLKK